MYEVRIYNGNKALTTDEIKLLKRVFSQNKTIYLSKKADKGFYISISGFSNCIKANEIKNIVQERIALNMSSLEFGSYQKEYDVVTDFKNKYLGKEIGTEIIFNQILVEKNNYIDIFKNTNQRSLYEMISRKLDEILLNHYFLNIRMPYIIPVFRRIADEFMDTGGKFSDSGYISHLSHFVGYYYAFSEEDKRKILECFEQKMLNLEVDNLDNIAKSSIDNLVFEVKRKVTEMICTEEIDFFSPYTSEEIEKKGHYATKKHELSFSNAEFVEFINHSTNLISSKWILNCLYEKLLLLNVSVLDKIFVNYFMLRNYSNINIEDYIEKFNEE